MLANHMIKRRDGHRDKLDVRRIRLHFHNCQRDIEHCVKKAKDINVSLADLSYPEVVKALHLIGFELGEKFEDNNPEAIGYTRRHRQYLIPT